MRRPRRAMLKEGHVDLCGCPHAALLLERILYRSVRNVHGGGWAQRTGAQLARDSLCGGSGARARRCLARLHAEGWLWCTRGPAGHDYAPVWTTIHDRLRRLDYRLSERLYGRTEGYMSEWNKEDRDREWEDIPGKYWPVAPGSAEQGTLDELKDRHKWAQRYKILDSASPLALDVSWLLWEKAGIEPTGTKKQWISACFDLASMAGSEEAMVQAVEEGVRVRNERGLTLSGPRSFLKFAANARSLRNLQARAGAGKQAADETTHPDGSRGPLHGQRWVKDADGRDVLVLGRR